MIVGKACNSCDTVLEPPVVPLVLHHKENIRGATYIYDDVFSCTRCFRGKQAF